MSKSITPNSASSIFVLVALQAPVIDLRHLFCKEKSFAAGLSLLILVSLDECYTVAPYIIAGQTMAVYIYLALLRVTSQVEAATLVRAIVCVIIFACIFLICEHHLSLPSIYRSRILSVALSDT